MTLPACLLGPNFGWLNKYPHPPLSAPWSPLLRQLCHPIHPGLLFPWSCPRDLLISSNWAPLQSRSQAHALQTPSPSVRLDPKTLSPSRTFPVSWPLSLSLGPWFKTIAIPLLTTSTLYHFIWQNPNPMLSSTLHTLSIHAAESGWGAKTKTVPHCLTVNPWPLTWVHPWH